MRQITIALLLTAFIIILMNCNMQENQYGNFPQIVTISGKIENYDSNRQVTVTPNTLGLRRETILAKIDSVGNFIATFECYHPVDVFITYKTNFLVLVHPGDNLFVQFNGNHNDRPELLGSISFKGSRAKTNQYAAKYQQMYYSNEIYFDWDKKGRAVKDYDIDQYTQYLDTVRLKNKEIFDKFVSENNPDEESKRWAKISSESDYYDFISWYARDHREKNNMGWNDSWDVPTGFYNRLSECLPIDQSMFISGYTLRGFSEWFFSSFVSDKLRERETKKDTAEVRSWAVLPGGGLIASSEIFDSIRIHSAIEFVHDALLLQIMLTNFFDKGFEKQDVTSYEKYRDVVNSYIKEPYLKEPLYQKYLQTKSRIDNPNMYTEAVLKDADNLSVKQIVDDILQQNKNKVVYIDFWATWCGPCLGEMPNSKVVEKGFEDKDVAFVYICLESNTEQWKANLDKFKLGGQHYFLSNKQSSDIRSLFKIQGIPFYILIDKNGVIKESGNHLRPLSARDKIKEMLK